MDREEERLGAALDFYDKFTSATSNVTLVDSFIYGSKWADKTTIDKACKVFQEMLVELCPELLGYGAAAAKWENEFRKRLGE